LSKNIRLLEMAVNIKKIILAQLPARREDRAFNVRIMSAAGNKAQGARIPGAEPGTGRNKQADLVLDLESCL